MDNKRIFWTLYWLGAGIIAFPALLSVLLLFCATTIPGRLMALFFICLIAFVFFLPFAIASVRRSRRGKELMIIDGLLGMLAVSLYGVCFSMAPDGQSHPAASFRQYYLNGGHFSRSSLFNMVPEVDQFNLGLVLLSMVDGSLTGDKGAKIKSDYQTVYREMERSDEFHALGSDMRYTYAELLTGRFDVGHIYVYIPPTQPQSSQTRLPVILFLHGSLGNFKGYMWALKSVADACGFAVVAPSFGMGNWGRPGGAEAVERARQWCASQPGMDANRVFLACLSNGGLGVMRAAIRNPNGYKGFISISGVLERDLVESNGFLSAWKDKPILVIQGDKDDRVLACDAMAAVEIMRLGGLGVTCKTYPEDDHFLFFAERENVARVIGEWLGKNGNKPERLAR